MSSNQYNTYDQVFRLADFCVTDRRLSREEKQLVAQIAAVGAGDPHTDAAACRLKLLLVVAGTKAERMPVAASAEHHPIVQRKRRGLHSCTA